MPSDVLMFRQSGFSIAMGNASDAVKGEASAVTDSNEDDGFAKAVGRFVLGERGRMIDRRTSVGRALSGWRLGDAQFSKEESGILLPQGEKGSSAGEDR